jgi:hypothetical protein
VRTRLFRGSAVRDAHRAKLARYCLLTICSLLVTLHSSSAGESRSTWLHFEPSVVELTGVIGVAYEYNQPSWGDDSRNDEKLGTPMLRLSKPINILGDPRSNTNQGDAENIEEVQLQIQRYRGLVGKRVIVTGTLSRGHAGWHFTEVEMTVKSVHRAAKAK